MKRFLLLIALFSSLSAFAVEIPPDYLDEVNILQHRAFNANAVRAFVYNVYFLFDKHVPVEEFQQHLVDKDLNMKFPEAHLKSHVDFQNWYKGVGDSIQSNTHTVESIAVKMNEDGTFGVHVIVLWQAINKKGEYLKFKADQNWVLVEDNGRLKIRDYLVKEAK
ncbi:MAG TPA: hypothetical protein PKO06_21505 [Candidatus Ozemobacteraceae bacterium]|nr:hypothetical protein [Candidatus Ozemobacteraceae bacterium]